MQPDIRTIHASTIAEELIKLFSKMGVPEEILTDQGTNFTSRLLDEVYRLLQIKPIRTTPYHPQTDCLVESNAKKGHRRGREGLGSSTTL